MSKTFLAIGAHYDDCVFGIPGLMLQAVAKHYRVVILTLIGDYTNWAPIGNRQREMLEGTVEICRSYGVEMRYLDFRSHRFDVNTESKKKVAAAVADIRADVACLLWRADNHDDHAVASHLGDIALVYGSSLVDVGSVPAPKQIYYFDNGPRHTIGFEPDTFVDVTDTWPQAIDWLGRFMALINNKPYQSGELDGPQRTKEAIARYRGATCGVKYAEALKARLPRSRDIL